MRFHVGFKIYKAALFAMAMLSVAPIAQAQLQNTIVFNSLSDLDKCMLEYRYDANYCMGALEAYAKKNPQEQFASGKRARLNFVHRSALRFFEPAMQKPTPAQCADDDVRMAVISGLNIPPDYDDNKRAVKILSGACFEALRPALEKEMISSGTGSYFKNAVCPILAAKQVNLASCAAPVAAKPEPKPDPEPVKLPTLDLSKTSINLIKVYTGPEGERVSVADVNDMSGVYLIRVDGVRSAINGKTFVHKEEVAGRTTTYWTVHDGKRWNTLSVQGTSYKDYNLNIPGTREGLRVSYSEAESKAAKADSLR